MGFFKKLFGKKEKEEKVEALPIETRNYNSSCEGCQTGIYDDQKSKKFGGKRFHIKCLRKLKKQTAKAHFG